MGTGVAVVTGGSRGIGAATVELLAALGWDVCVTFREREAEAAELVARCNAVGRRALAVRADVSVEADVLELFAKVDRDLGAITTLVNNAGVVGARSRVDEMSADRVRQMFAVNVVGAFTCAREAIHRMSTRHGGAGGAIVNVSSVATRIGSPASTWTTPRPRLRSTR